MSPSAVKIHRAKGGDVKRLLPLVCGFRDSLQRADPPDTSLRAAITEALSDPKIEFTYATLKGADVAYAQTHFRYSIWTHSEVAYLEDLFVLPSARRHHVGRQLLNDIFDRARRRGAKELTLTTNENNLPAQNLYRAAGMSPQTEARWNNGREVPWAIAL